jgi:cobaltochelatase CobN
MHILATTSASLDDRVEPVDLRQQPGDIAFLSFTDSDLAALAAAWRATAGRASPLPLHDENPPPLRGRVGRGGAAGSTSDVLLGARRVDAEQNSNAVSAAPPLPTLPREGGGFPHALSVDGSGAFRDNVGAEPGARAPLSSTLRLASLRDLRHPMSVDLWIDGVAAAARVVVVRLLGGLDWWRYGVERLAALAAERTRAGGLPLVLAVLPGDDRDDPRLADFSTLPPERLAALLAYFREGGAENMRNFARQLRAMAASGAGLSGRDDRTMGHDASPPPSQSVDAPTGWHNANPPPSRPVDAPTGWHNANPPPSRGRVGRGGAADSTSDVLLGARRVDAEQNSNAESAAPPLPTLPREGGGLPGSKASVGADAADAPIPAAVPIPRATAWLPDRGAVSLDDLLATLPAANPVVPVIFYRSMLLADDLAPVAALVAALSERGLAAVPLAVASLKEPGSKAFVAEALGRLAPAAIVTATAFAAVEPGEPTVLDAAGVPVLQAIVATTRREAWSEGRRGLAAADMAMHVVLPELDGRVLAGALSFKDTAPPDPEFGFTALVNRAEDGRVGMVADRVAALVRLQATPPAERRLAVLLPDYPGPAGRAGYAVGLDVPESTVALLADLAEAGWSVEEAPADGTALMRALVDPARSSRSPSIGGGLAEHNANAPPSRSVGVPSGWHNANPPPSRGRVGRGGAAGSTADVPPGASRDDAEPKSDPEPAAPPLPALPREGGGFAWADAAVQSPGTASGCTPDHASLPLATYRSLFAALPAGVREAVTAAWGDPADDADVADGAFRFRARRFGAVTVALPPDRGRTADRRADYHDPALPPRHGLLAFGLWLQHALDVHAVVHMGAHGTFEWLPGKAVALTEACFPEVVLGPLPVIYPFIVTNPGEAAQAKRRIAAVTLGHLPPPLVAGALEGPLADLERLVDEYASADGLDGRRRERLAALILEEAERSGLARDAGAEGADGPDEALKRIDAWLCDVKELSLKDGLHVYGRSGPATGEADGGGEDTAERRGVRGGDGTDGASARRASAAAERAGLLAALDGRRVAAGPAGAPSRGRADVLPTGRNLYTADPRTLPTPTAVELGRRAADEVVRLYLQEHGDWPRSVVLDLWGSSTLRTGGEEIAQALALLGCRPAWDRASGRVTGVEVLPTAALGRPRVDVTCRISGLFRDLFPVQIALLDAAVQAVAAREEDDGENPLAARRRAVPTDPLARVYGTAPGAYGSGIDERLTFGDWDDRAELGRAYLAAASHAFQGEGDGVATVEVATTFDENANVNPPPSRGRVGRGGAANSTPDVPAGAGHPATEPNANPESAAPPLPALPREGGGFAPGAGRGSAPGDGFAARVAAADMLVHGADDPGRDLLEGGGDVGFVGGFAAAAALLGATPDLVVLDTRTADRPVARPLAAEIARVVRGRALSKRFIAGQMRHGWRGATELAEAVDRLIGFAETTGSVPGHLIDAVHAAYLGDPAVRAFLIDANPDAARLIARRFADARRRGLWHPRRNDIDADLAALLAEAAE